MIARAQAILHRVKIRVARHPDFWIGAGLGAAVLALYLRTMPPTVLEGDSGEYQYMAYVLGVPHSTGYPLYILLAKLFTFLPAGDVAYRVTLFSAVGAALTAPLVYAIARRISQARIPAVLAAMMLAVAPTMWGAAIDAEVYALHLFLGTLALFFALRWHQEHRPRDPSTEFILRNEGIRTSLYLLALVFGLGLANHRVFLFIAPALALVLWLNRAQLNRSTLARGALLVGLPLLLYAYIPIRASQLIAQQDPANWELYKREDAILKGTVSAYYRNSLDGFINLVTGFDNRSKLGFKSPLEEANRIELATTLLLQQFGVVGIGLAFVGVWESFRRDRKMFSILLTFAAGIGFIAIYLRGESTVYYFSLAYLVVALWLGLGANWLMRWAGQVRRRATTSLVAAFASPRVVVCVLALLPLSALVGNLPRFDKSNYLAARDFAQAVLRDNLAANAVVIAPWEIATPIRYYQFVENQRADLLVVHVSPTQYQFETILANARKLERPFYQVQFTPELKTTPGLRSVQAIPLPLRDEPRPRYALSNARLVPEVQVLGYDVEPDLPQPGKPMRVLVYYRTLARMYPLYTSVLSIGDIRGRPWGDYPNWPGSYYYPTYRWQTGEVYRTAWTIDLPADAPSGLYTFDLSWYVYNLDSGQTDYERAYKLALGAIRVGDFPTVTKIAHPQTARVGEAITFLGWDIQSTAIARGQSLNLDLFWRAERAVTESYTVFAHLTDASGRVVTTIDSPPYDGMFPTNRWTVGEIVRDRHTLQVPANLAPGEYGIEVGMYLLATGQRLPIETESNRADKIALTRIRVQ
jgi:hypothetical protein